MSDKIELSDDVLHFFGLNQGKAYLLNSKDKKDDWSIEKVQEYGTICKEKDLIHRGLKILNAENQNTISVNFNDVAFEKEYNFINFSLENKGGSVNILASGFLQRSSSNECKSILIENIASIPNMETYNKLSTPDAFADWPCLVYNDNYDFTPTCKVDKDTLFEKVIGGKDNQSKAGFIFGKNLPLVTSVGDIGFYDRNASKAFYISLLKAMNETDCIPKLFGVLDRNPEVRNTIYAFPLGNDNGFIELLAYRKYGDGILTSYINDEIGGMPLIDIKRIEYEK